MMNLNMRLLKQILGTLRPSYAPVTWFHPLLDSRLPKDAKKVQDDYGNIFVLVGDSEQSDVAFTSHLDTVARSNSRPPKLGFDPNSGLIYLKNPDEADCLGADCGAGVYLMLEMIEHGVHGRYCFFRDEEVGCEGSGESSKDNSGFWTGVKAMISFDRRGTGVITSQRWSRCCSDTFALELAKRLGRGPEHLQAGVYTDSAEFTGIVPECTNIGVGYLHEHTPDETLDANVLEELLGYCLAPGTFSNLPIVREPVADDLFSWGHLPGSQFAMDAGEESPDLLKMFREVSQLSRKEMVRWVQENPEEAATYIMVFSDYGFKADIVEVGTRVINDWGGIENFY